MEYKTFYSDLPKNVYSNSKNKINCIIMDFWLSIQWKTSISQLANYCSNISLDVENKQTIEPHKFSLNLTEKLDLNSSNKHVAVQTLCICYTWRNIRE